MADIILHNETLNAFTLKLGTKQDICFYSTEVLTNSETRRGNKRHVN